MKTVAHSKEKPDIFKFRLRSSTKPDVTQIPILRLPCEPLALQLIGADKRSMTSTNSLSGKKLVISSIHRNQLEGSAKPSDRDHGSPAS